MDLGRLPTTAMGSIVDAHADEQTITRVTETVNDLGEIITEETTVTRSVWTYSPSASTLQYYGGERTNGSLMALCTDESGLQLDDRLTVNDIEYEVDSITTWSESTPVLTEYMLVRRNGPSP